LDVSGVLEGEVEIAWSQQRGPVVEPPASSNGFGSKLLHRVVTGQLDGSNCYDWTPSRVGRRASIEESPIVGVIPKRVILLPSAFVKPDDRLLGGLTDGVLSWEFRGSDDLEFRWHGVLICSQQR
jgi:hypothetical protein